MVKLESYQGNTHIEMQGMSYIVAAEIEVIITRLYENIKENMPEDMQDILLSRLIKILEVKQNDTNA